MTGTDDWSRLSAGLTGEVLVSAERIDAAEPRVLERFRDVRPTAVARCADTDDVVSVVRELRRRGRGAVVRSGGHDFAGRSTAGGVVLDVSALRSVVLDGRRARIGAGTPLGDVYRELGAHGRAIPAGCGPDVAVSGLTLGGGLGVLGRRHGLTCDSLVAARVVLADGRTVRCDDSREPELFWAMRGAGSCGLGVVTELEFETVVAPTCTVVRLTWPVAAAGEVFAHWQDWSPDAGDDVALSLLVNAPSDPSREPVVTVFGAVLDTDVDEVNELLDRFVAAVGQRASSRLVEEHGLVDGKRRLAELGPGEEGGAGYLHSDYVRGALPSATIEAVLTWFTADRVAGEARELDVSPWAGAYNRVAPEATAFCHRGERFLLKHTATVPVGQRPGPWLDRSWELVRAHGSGGVYPNFPDATLPDPARAYYGANLERVQRVRQRYDPHGMFTPPATQY